MLVGVRGCSSILKKKRRFLSVALFSRSSGGRVWPCSQLALVPVYGYVWPGAAGIATY